jgi:hypothetical protein
MPVLHDSLEPGMSQTELQEPQFVRLVSDASQPLFALLSQLPHSPTGLQEKPQPVAMLQLALPCALVHDSVQVRQALVVPLEVSQPGALVQSRKPWPAVPPVVLQAITAQLPVAQVAVAFGWLHVTPQSPQFVSVRMFVSQPLRRSASQAL